MPVTVRQRNLASRPARKVLTGRITNKKSSSWKSSMKSRESDVLVTNAPTDSCGIMFPSPTTALLFLLIGRLIAAGWAHITDCDETYNYWEPLHYLVFGSGMQTWEYSPAYAIRSYAPLCALAAPAVLLRAFFNASSLFLFYFLRCLLAICAAVSEAWFYKAVCRQFGVHIARMWLVIAVTSSGGFISSAALLPSAWCGALATAALACWWRDHFAAAVAFTALSALAAWPFAGLLGAPIAIDILVFRRRYLDFAKWCLYSLLVILVPLVAVDTWYYGKLTVAPWNIVAYNIFTEHGPDLYGVEPWSYYFVNGFLNFNVIWVLALVCPLLLVACQLLVAQTPRLHVCSPYWLSLMPLYTWLLVFWPQSHKEERFLFPVYNMIILCGAVCIDCIQKLTYTLKIYVDAAIDKWTRAEKSPVRRSHYLAHTNFVMLIFVGIAVLGGVSRILSLHRNYNAPMWILRPLPCAPPGTGLVHVCFGKEWHRSPSSFHLPHHRYRIRFIKSEFSGQLPAQYSSEDNATRIAHAYFNDANLEDTSTYLNASSCHYLVDSDLAPPAKLQPHYHETKQFAVVASLPFLDAAESHPLFRAFYVPFVGQVNFGSLYLLRNKALVPKP